MAIKVILLFEGREKVEWLVIYILFLLYILLALSLSLSLSSPPPPVRENASKVRQTFTGEEHVSRSEAAQGWLVGRTRIQAEVWQMQTPSPQRVLQEKMCIHLGIPSAPLPSL